MKAPRNLEYTRTITATIAKRKHQPGRLIRWRPLYSVAVQKAPVRFDRGLERAPDAGTPETDGEATNVRILTGSPSAGSFVTVTHSQVNHQVLQPL
jgi:hypothetical protein